jgi:hypothetical protein
VGVMGAAVKAMGGAETVTAARAVVAAYLAFPKAPWEDTKAVVATMPEMLDGEAWVVGKAAALAVMAREVMEEVAVWAVVEVADLVGMPTNTRPCNRTDLTRRCELAAAHRSASNNPKHSTASRGSSPTLSM